MKNFYSSVFVRYLSVLMVFTTLTLLSSCTQSKIETNSDADEHASSIEPSSEENGTEGTFNIEHPAFDLLSPFDDSITHSEYRLVSTSQAIAPNGIYFIDPKHGLQLVSGVKSEKLAENVSQINGLTAEWIYCTTSSEYDDTYTYTPSSLVRISLIEKKTEKILENINCAVYSADQDRVYYCTYTDPIEIHALDLATELDTLIFTDEGIGDELDYAYDGWFIPQSDGTVVLTWDYPYPSEIPYSRYLKIDNYEIVGDSEQAPCEVEFSVDMRQIKTLCYKHDWEAYLEQRAYHGGRKLMVAGDQGNPPANGSTLFFEQNGVGEKIAHSKYWVYYYAYCFDKVYYRNDDVDFAIYDLVSKKTIADPISGVREIFSINNKLFAFISTGYDNATYSLVELDQDAEIIQTIYEQKADFTEDLGSQTIRAIQVGDYILLSTAFWAEDVLSFSWCYNTKTGESLSIVL